MEDNMNPVERTAADLNEYVSLHLDKLKLRLLDNFATLFNAIFGVILLVILLSFATLFLACAMTWGLSLLFGSLMAAILTVAGIFLIASWIVWINRKKLIINPAVQLLSKVMFEKGHYRKNNDTEDQYE